MKYRKTLLLKILMGVASIRLISDLILITIMGATYTWFGVLTALFNCFILGVGLDVVRG
jgi:uncharacterized membrane protein